jgi:oligopeptide transport system substrate-binding protein
MKLRLLLQIACVLIVLALLATSCSSGGPGPGDTTSNGTLTLFAVGPLTLDPALARSDTSLTYIVEIFSGLVSFDPELNLVPEIAERWEISSDGKTYTFYLRDSVKFHNGREVTASDFKYSIERACNPATGSQTAETYLGDIVGVREKLSGEIGEVSGIQVIDDNTLQITIDVPKEYFLSKLAHPVAYVVDQTNVESGAYWWHSPNGTGSFQLKEWQRDDFITLERNGLYYLEPPKVEQVVFLLWGGVPMRMYETGEIDVTDVYLGDIERVLDPTNPLNEELSIIPELSLSFIGFNATKPPFDDVSVRQAFCHAIDKDKIVELVLKDLVNTAHGILPPVLPGHNEEVQGLDFDADLAKRLLAESEYGAAANLPPITLTSYGRGTVSNLEAALIDMWRRNLGVEVEIRQLEPEKYPFLLMQEKDELYMFGWGADYPDPQNFLDVLFHSDTPDNFGEYSNSEVDDLLEEARKEKDVTARMNLYQQAEQILVNDAACIPIYFDISYVLTKPYIKNLPLAPLWMPRLKYISVEPH